ncbi:hypothetical protein GTW46_08645, partial [Streptomyces sp. SID6013]|nr:hypothetical protein [Streptomyces sp. SID6013]
MLNAAAQAWQAAPGAPLSRFVSLPAPHTAARWLQDTAAVDATAVAALGLAGPEDVGAAERARVFWARVKAVETSAAAGPDTLTRRVLHLDPALDVDGAGHESALALLTRGFAAGRDMADPDVAAAYALETGGAFDWTATLTTMGTESGGGRDWRDTTTLLPEVGRVRTPAGLADAPWAGPDGHGGNRPVPYLVAAHVDLQDNTRLQVSTGGTLRDTSAAEFAELLAADPDLNRRDLSVPVLLVLTGIDGPAPGVADTIAQRLGRSVWWSRYPAELSGTDDTGSSVPTLVPSLVTAGTPTAADWQEARPTDPAHPEEGPRPVAPPLPEAPLA